jgi:tetratricopeptide (TPR) repeat protein
MASVGRGESRDKVIERAQALAQRGAVGRAIAALDDWLAANPADDRILLRVADLRRRVGDDAGAVDAFSKAAGLYAARGFSSKVAAVLQQALAISPDDPALLERLAAAKIELQLPIEAARCLDRIAQAVAAAGDAGRVLDLRRRIHELLPGDAGAALRLADALVASGAREEAIGLLAAAVEPLREPAKVELWLLLQERLADLLPDDHARAREIARVLLARSAPKRALARLKTCLAADRGDLEALELLAQCFGALNQPDRVIAAWREIAHAHAHAGRPDEAHAAWVHVRELSPADPEAAAFLAPPLPPRKADATLEEDLAEADFFTSEGMTDEARAILLRLRELFPENPEVEARLEQLDVETVPLGELIAADEELVEAAEPTEESTTDILDRSRTAAPAEESGAALLALAETHIEMDRFEEAQVELNRALAVDPALEGPCLALVGRCHLARGEPGEAVDAYRNALASPTLHPDEAADVLCELAGCFELMGDRDEALRCLEQAKRLQPDLVDDEASLLGLAGAQA